MQGDAKTGVTPFQAFATTAGSVGKPGVSPVWRRQSISENPPIILPAAANLTGHHTTFLYYIKKDGPVHDIMYRAIAILWILFRICFKLFMRKLCFHEQGMRESNSHQRFWRPLSYHLTNPLYCIRSLLKRMKIL